MDLVALQEFSKRLQKQVLAQHEMTFQFGQRTLQKLIC